MDKIKSCFAYRTIKTFYGNSRKTDYFVESELKAQEA